MPCQEGTDIQEIERKRAGRTTEKTKPYSAVIKETVKESQMKTKPIQIVVGSVHGFLITTCIMHAHFVNLARTGSYEAELNRMLKSNGLPPVVVPLEVPSEELFGARMAENVKVAVSVESLRS